MRFSNNAIRAYRRRGKIPTDLTENQCEQLVRLAFPVGTSLVDREVHRVRKLIYRKPITTLWRPDHPHGRVEIE